MHTIPPLYTHPVSCEDVTPQLFIHVGAYFLSNSLYSNARKFFCVSGNKAAVMQVKVHGFDSHLKYSTAQLQLHFYTRVHAWYHEKTTVPPRYVFACTTLPRSV